MTFEQAREDLRLLAEAYNAGRVDRFAWYDSVSDVIASYQKGVAERLDDAALGTAFALPRVADPTKPGAAQVAVVAADRDSGHRHSMLGHTA